MMKKHKYDFPEATYYFNANFYQRQVFDPPRMTDKEAAELVDYTRTKVSLKGPARQEFVYRRHIIYIRLMTPTWVDFEIFRCAASRIYAHEFGHTWCQEQTRCEVIDERDTTRKRVAPKLPKKSS